MKSILNLQNIAVIILIRNKLIKYSQLINSNIVILKNKIKCQQFNKKLKTIGIKLYIMYLFQLVYALLE